MYAMHLCHKLKAGPYIACWLVAAFIGIASGLLCLQYQISFGRGAGDISWPLCGAQAIFAGGDPYLCPHLLSNGQPAPSNPLTTALVILPFSFLPPAWVAGCFFGLSSAFLSLGLTRDGQWWRLLVFLAFPYWAAPKQSSGRHSSLLSRSTQPGCRSYWPNRSLDCRSCSHGSPGDGRLPALYLGLVHC